MSKSEIQTNEAKIILRELNISLLKTKINFIFPVGGGIINEFLFDLYGRIKQERVNKFVDELGKRFENMEKSAINKEYLQTDEFLDLISKTFEIAAKSHSNHKRNFLANILADAAGAKLATNEQIILFTNFIESFSINHIKILRFIRDHGANLIEIGSYERYYENFITFNPTSQIDKHEFKYYNFDLETKSLVSTGSGLENFDDTSSRIALEDHRDASVLLTSFGEKFIRYLTE